MTDTSARRPCRYGPGVDRFPHPGRSRLTIRHGGDTPRCPSLRSIPWSDRRTSRSGGQSTCAASPPCSVAPS